MKSELEPRSMTSELVSFRPLEVSHLSQNSFAQDIYRLRFLDPEVVAQSETNEVPTFQDHVSWLKRHLEHHPFFYLLTRSEKFLGYIHGRYESAGIILSVALIKEERKKGIAGRAIEYVLQQFGGTIWYARILSGNEASLGCFEKNGFEQMYQSATMIILKKATR